MTGHSDASRFVCILDPLDQWMVWDDARGEPAVINGQYAIGLSLAEAEAVLAELLSMGTTSDGRSLSVLCRRTHHPQLRPRLVT